MKRRDLIKKLEANGLRKIRDNGDHTIYKGENTRPVQVPRHREINETTAREIIKAAGLK